MNYASAAPVTQPLPQPSALRRVLGLIGSVVAALVVAAAFLALIATQFLGYKALAVVSDSMVPALHKGDLILSRPVAITDVKQGDIVVFEEGDQTRLLVAHGVVAITNVTVNATDSKTGKVTTSKTSILQTKGDANPAPDGTAVDASRFKGVLLATVPTVGSVLTQSATTTVLLGLLAVIGIAWIAYEIVHARRSRGASIDR